MTTSPRPWYFDGRDIFSTGPTDDTGGHRLVVPLPNTFHPSQRVSDADAELIVYAVNHIEAVEADLRREWWINHGHDYFALYGDDGEMQCGRCLCDFKRDPIERLREVVTAARLAKAAEVSSGS